MMLLALKVWACLVCPGRIARLMKWLRQPSCPQCSLLQAKYIALGKRYDELCGAYERATHRTVP